MTIAPISIYDVAAQQAWLEDQAAKGRFLDSYFGLFAVFAKGPPAAVRYRLEPLRRKETLPNHDRRETYRAMGWTYVTTVGGIFHVWCCGDPAAPELDTDPQVRAAAYDWLLARLRRANRVIAAVYVGMFVLVAAVNLKTPGGFLTGQVQGEMPLWQVLPSVAALIFLLWQIGQWQRSLRRFLKTLRAGIPTPQRRPYRLSRCLAAVGAALYAAYMLTLTASLFRLDSRDFTPVEELEEPVPYVELAGLDNVQAMPWEDYLTSRQWWILQEGDGRAQSRYYALRFSWLAGPLTAELREEKDLCALEVPELDGAWWGLRDDGAQILLLRRGRAVLETVYQGGEDLRNHLDDYAAVLREEARP